MDYLKHLLEQLEIKKEAAISQRGKSDIEPYDYVLRTSAWFESLIQKVTDSPPSYYVESLTVFQKEGPLIDSIEYDYYEPDDRVDNSSLIIELLD